MPLHLPGKEKRHFPSHLVNRVYIYGFELCTLKASQCCLLLPTFNPKCVIPTIPFTQAADSTQQGGSVPPPIDRAIDQQIGIINWGIIHPSSATPFPLLHFHYASFWRRGTEGETGHDRHLPLISILIKRPSDNDQSKQSAGQKIPEHKETECSVSTANFPTSSCRHGQSVLFFLKGMEAICSFPLLHQGTFITPFFIVFFQFICTFPTVV